MTRIVIDLDGNGPVIEPSDSVIARGDGRHAVALQWEDVIYAHVAGGKITHYSADKNGQTIPVQMYHVEVSKADASGVKIEPAVEVHCWKCVCANDFCACEEVPCK